MIRKKEKEKTKNWKKQHFIDILKKKRKNKEKTMVWKKEWGFEEIRIILKNLYISGIISGYSIKEDYEIYLNGPEKLNKKSKIIWNTQKTEQKYSRIRYEKIKRDHPRAISFMRTKEGLKSTLDKKQKGGKYIFTIE